ncbi:hypothetical protein [Oceaniglobus ichthyenteri]|uniref:hypothetical protein n=1 Tax=Oceaniglobus ichthyenteri TaxID=2136177 RepID=UPI000F8215B1|nr:hypothetical protein [Oceaniglobus ichthyenteri]
MTLVLKSNNAASNSTGNVHGMSGPTDFVAMLDFSRDEYYTVLSGDRADYSLSNAVSVSRSSVAPYALRDGVMRSASANIPRRHYLSSVDAEGLLVMNARQNLLSSGGAGGVSIPGATEWTILSYTGGSAELSHANLTLESTRIVDGRTVKAYSRSPTSTITATLSVSGATDLQVELASGGRCASPFMGYSATVAIESASLHAPFKDLLASGVGTVVVRSVALRGADADTRNFTPVAVQTSSPLGGVAVTSSRTTGSSGTDNGAVYADGAAWNGSTDTASVTGNWRDSMVHAIGFDGFGDNFTVASFGQISKSTGNGAVFGAPTAILIGGASAYASAPNRCCSIITHVVIYQRMLTDDELLIIANQWV